MVAPTAAQAMTPGIRMASWSFYLGLLGFLAVAFSPALRAFPTVMPFVVYGGVAFAAIAVVFGIVGLGSLNRAGAFAGLLLGALALLGFWFFVR